MTIGEIKKRGNWGWCLLCEQAIHPDVFWEIGLSDHYKCPFLDCDGAEIGIDLWEIGVDGGKIPETWPTDETPVHGETYLLYGNDISQDDNTSVLLAKLDTTVAEDH